MGIAVQLLVTLGSRASAARPIHQIRLELAAEERAAAQLALFFVQGSKLVEVPFYISKLDATGGQKLSRACIADPSLAKSASEVGAIQHLPQLIWTLRKLRKPLGLFGHWVIERPEQERSLLFVAEH